MKEQYGKAVEEEDDDDDDEEEEAEEEEEDADDDEEEAAEADKDGADRSADDAGGSETRDLFCDLPSSTFRNAFCLRRPHRRMMVELFGMEERSWSCA